MAHATVTEETYASIDRSASICIAGAAAFFLPVGRRGHRKTDTLRKSIMTLTLE
jgi:hypothetical protein